MKKIILLLLLIPNLVMAEKIFKGDVDKFGYYSGRILGICTALQHLKQEFCPGMQAIETNARLCLGYVTILLPKDRQKKGFKMMEKIMEINKVKSQKIGEETFMAIYRANHRIEDNRRGVQSCNEVENVYKGELTKSLSVLKSINPENLK